MNAELTPSSASINDSGSEVGSFEAFAVEPDQPSPAICVRERQFDRLVDPAGSRGERRLEKIRAVRGKHEEYVVVLV